MKLGEIWNVTAESEKNAHEKSDSVFCVRLQYGTGPDGAALSGGISAGEGCSADYKLTERLYADIDFLEGVSVSGFLYLITERHLKSLDAYEGYPKVYRRMWLDVEFRGETYQAVTYEMTAETKLVRNGLSYPEEYRKICSAGAKFRHVKNQFVKRRTKG